MIGEALAAYDASLRIDPGNAAVRRERDETYAIGKGKGVNATGNRLR